MVPCILQQILGFFKSKSKDSVQELVEYLDDLNITNEMMKEHLMILSMDKKLEEAFAKIESGAKAHFTRTYNKLHQDVVRKKATRGKRGAQRPDSDEESLSSNDEEDVVIDEEELAEIKKAK